MVLSVLPFFGKARNNSDFECIYRFLINHSQLLVAAIISYDTQSVKKKFSQKKNWEYIQDGNACIASIQFKRFKQ